MLGSYQQNAAKKWQDIFCSYRRQTVESRFSICPHSGECGYTLFGSGLSGLGAKGDITWQTTSVSSQLPIHTLTS